MCCEGKTEARVLMYFRQQWRALIEVHGEVGVPMTIVQAAKKKQRELRRGYAKSHIYVVFDWDEHPNFDNAYRASIDIGVSVPCFEFWGVLLWTDHTQHTHRHDMQRALATRDPGYDHKKNPFLSEASLENWLAAEARAKKTRKSRTQHYPDKPYTNPITYFDTVLRTIYDATQSDAAK